MNTATADFDTHQFVKDMTGEGMAESQAEKLAVYIKQYHERLVTREYFQHHLDMRLAEVREQIAELETRLTMRMLWICGGMGGVIIAAVGFMIRGIGAGG